MCAKLKTPYGRLARSVAGCLMPLAATGAAAAADSGSFEFTTTFDNKLISLRLDGATAPSPRGRAADRPGDDGAGSYAFAGSVDGVAEIVESSGGPFAAGDEATYQCVASGISVSGWVEVAAYCVMTDLRTGDKWYRKSMRTADDYNAGTGRMTLFGGTGKFSGIEGDCSYQVTYSAPWSKGSLRASCDWRIPEH